MFGVTTSDDYRPVTWMGRYPGRRHDDPGRGARRLRDYHRAARGCSQRPCSTYACSIARRSGAGQIWRLATYAFIHPSRHAALVRDRNVHALFLRPRSGTIHRPARVYCSLRALAFRSVAYSHPLGLGTTDRTGWIGRAALRCFHRVRHPLPERPILSAYPGKMDFCHSRRDRNAERLLATMLDGSGRSLDQHRARLFFVSLRGAGPELAWSKNFKARLRPKPKFNVVPKSLRRDASR